MTKIVISSIFCVLFYLSGDLRRVCFPFFSALLSSSFGRFVTVRESACVDGGLGPWIPLKKI